MIQRIEVGVEDATSVIFEVYVQKLHIFEINATVNEYICVAAQVFLAENDWIQVRREDGIWREQTGFSSVQSFTQPVLLSLSSYNNYFSLFQICHHIPLHHWSAVWRARFHRVE